MAFAESRSGKRAKKRASRPPRPRPRAAPSRMETGTPARAAGEKRPPEAIPVKEEKRTTTNTSSTDAPANTICGMPCSVP